MSALWHYYAGFHGLGPVEVLASRRVEDTHILMDATGVNPVARPSDLILCEVCLYWVSFL